MKVEQTDDLFLVINELDDQPLSYAKTAREAVLKAGMPEWNCLFQGNAASALAPGDELSLTSHASVIRLTGKDIDYRG